MTRVVAFAPDPSLANLIRSMLESQGVRVFDVQTTPHASFVGADTCYYVEVVDEDYERAVACLKGEDLEKWIFP